MKRLINSHHQRRGYRTIAVKALPLILASFLIAGCQTGANSFGQNLNWFNSSEAAVPETVVLARDSASLVSGSEVEKTLYDAVELSRQKRFVEARQLLAEVRQSSRSLPLLRAGNGFCHFENVLQIFDRGRPRLTIKHLEIDQKI